MLGATVLIAKVINSKNPMPILGDIFCEVKDNQLTMVGGDGECSIRTNLELQTMEGEGKFCVHAGRLLDALRQMPEQPLTITCCTESDYMFTIEHQDGQIHFLSESADEYPIIDEPLPTDPFELDGKRIADAIKRCLWSVCTQDLRPAMCGVHMCTVAKHNSLDIVASNGHTLVRNRLYGWNEHQYDGKIEATIPTKAAKVMADTLTDGNVNLRFNESKCQVGNDRYTMTFRLIAENYPKYNSVIPSDNVFEASVDKIALKQSIQRVLPFAPNASELLQLHFDESYLRINSYDYDFSMGADDKLDVEMCNCESLNVGLKGSTLLKAISYINGASVLFKMKDANTAVLLEPDGQEEQTEVTILLMPMLLNN
jgi:DNA polymerase-3 subunit beta